MILALLAYFHPDERIHDVAVCNGQQMPDGGWNWIRKGATHSSLHTTISAPRIVRVRVFVPERKAISKIRARDMNFARASFAKSHKTGKVFMKR